MVKTTGQVVRRAREEKADLYHLHDPELLPWARLMSSEGENVLYDMHESLPKQIMTKEWVPPALRGALSLCFRSIERVLLQNMAVVFAEASYSEDYPWLQKSATVLNFPRLDDFPDSDAPRRSRPTVGYIGRVAPERGSTVMVKAIDRLHERGLEAHLECIGPVTPLHRKELVRSVPKDVRKFIRFHGYVEPPDAWQTLRACHAGIAILKDSPNYRNSYPTKMFDYMALNLPVVASDVPLYSEVVEEEGCGICVDPDDPISLADALERLLTHQEEAVQMGRRGRALVEGRYNWASQQMVLREFYAEILSG
jgi:glycosyltransferase involved in cell wall biosynthesis